MTRRVSQFVARTAFAVALISGAMLSPTVAAPIYPIDLAQQTGASAERASFWGRAYPYGHAYRRNPCIRYTRVHTRHGWRTKRISICRR